MMEILTSEDDWDEILRYDFAFHQALIEATGSARLRKFYRSISTEMRLALTYYKGDRFSPKQISREHRELLDSIATFDADVAVRACQVHLEESEVFINRQVEEISAESRAPAGL